jgi:ubiquinol-cytochrome c reductase cytochrome b subunit
MSTGVKPNWTASWLPFISNWQSGLAAPMLAKEAPYLAILPWLVTAGVIFLTLSGLVLAVYYNPAHAFDSIQFIDRNVNNGWLVQGFHETGATMVFGAAYLALLRGLWVRGYKAPFAAAWAWRIKIFCWLLIAGWIGFTLSGGADGDWSLTRAAQASLLLTGAPGAFGTWFFGGPNGAGTLPRMLVFHVIVGVILFGALAAEHSANKAATPRVLPRDAVAFHPYYTSQYFVALSVFALIFAVLVFFAPRFGQPFLNLVPASPLVVPAKILFPWYLAPVSGLGSVLPGIYGGIIGVVAGLGVLFALPWLDRSGPNFRPGALYKFLTLLLALDVVGLGWAASTSSGLGGVLLAVFGFWYFLHFLVLTPLVTAMEAE